MNQRLLRKVIRARMKGTGVKFMQARRGVLSRVEHVFEYYLPSHMKRTGKSREEAENFMLRMILKNEEMWAQKNMATYSPDELREMQRTQKHDAQKIPKPEWMPKPRALSEEERRKFERLQEELKRDYVRSSINGEILSALHRPQLIGSMGSMESVDPGDPEETGPLEEPDLYYTDAGDPTVFEEDTDKEVLEQLWHNLLDLDKICAANVQDTESDPLSVDTVSKPTGSSQMAHPLPKADS